MQTYTHFLLTAALNHGLKQRKIEVNSRMLLLGSVLPDVPLMLLTVTTWIYYGWINPIVGPDERTSMTGFVFRLMDQFYFTDPVWIAGHSLFHSVVMIAGYLALGAFADKRGWPWGKALIWLAIGCGLHSLIDIVTHYNDGPVIFFPLNWSYRFQSPISYWDDDHYGNIVAPIEHLVDLGIIIFFAVLGARGWLKRRQQQQAS